MIRVIKFIILIFITVIVIIYINHKIAIYDLRFYFGKDNGLVIIFKSIIILSTLFYLLMAKNRLLLYAFIGFITGIISSIFVYLIIAISIEKHSDNMMLIFHINAMLVSIILFFVIENILQKYIKNR